MRNIFSLFSVLAFVLVLALYTLPPKAIAAGNLPLSNLVISEVQTGGCTEYSTLNECINEDANMEFVELYNPLSTELQVNDWEIQYLSASGTTVTTLVSLNGKILPYSYVLLSHQGYLSGQADLFFSKSLAKSGGHIRIVDDSNQTVDLIGWGTASATGSWPKVSEIAAGFSAKRIFPGDPLDGNGIIFTPPTFPATPESGGYIVDSPSDDGTGGDNDNGDDGGSEPQTSCGGVIISELLPNPAGSDKNNEFIELYNPTVADISLSGCGLQFNNGPISLFGEVSLGPGHYMAFYDDNTGITLTNSSGGTIYLLDSGVELQSVDYPADLDDDVAWAWFGGSGWQQTYTPTPGAENISQPDKPCPEGQFRNPETNRCNSVGTGGSTLEPCRPDQFRNPLTNRCKLKDDGSGLQPCRPDQFRNPLTNRCKLKDSGSSLKPCDPDQFRNPETNRCKKIDSGYQLKPCKPDQERNPETNRCRKVQGTSTDDLTKVKDIEAPIVSGGYGWLAAGVAGGGVLAYAGWEWRRELLALFGGLKSKLPF